jgi:hypothetical protein
VPPIKTMTRPTKEELHHCYHILNMKQSEISEKFDYHNVPRLLSKYGIEKKKRGIFRTLTAKEMIQRFKDLREDKGQFYNYSQVEYINSQTKIKIICPLHGEFYQYPLDHVKGYDGCKKCSKLKSTQTNLERYGVENPFQSEEIKNKIKQKNLEKYGVENPSQSPKIHQKKIETSLKNYGCEYPTQSEIIKEKSKQTNFNKYGVSCAMKIPEIAQKSVEMRFKNNNYIKYTSSEEAKNYIKGYIKEKNYKLNQCAFSDAENGLYEWGYQYKGKWILYDLVVFEEGFRGNKDKIIEILEYHGPFHYEGNDVKERGEEKATPWVKSKLTIKESYEIDKLKEEFAKTLTKCYNVIWSKKYHRND